MTPKNALIISDRQDIPLAHAVLESPPEACIWQVRVLDGGLGAVIEHEFVKLFGVGDGIPATAGRILRHKNDVLTLEPVGPLGEGARENLRVAVKFDSFLYPVTGNWKGRVPILVQDLSSGGVGFFCAAPLQNGEEVEVVISITEEPLILTAQILRPRPSASQVQLYAARFLNLVPGEDTMIREAVFSQQLFNRSKRPLPPT